MPNNREKGNYGEKLAAERLMFCGYTILASNFRCRSGEIDIIAKKSDCIVFIEVKYRKSLRYGYPAEAVTPLKQRTIRAVADYYTHTNQLSGMDFRFDVIQIIDGEELYIEHIENAF